MENEKILELDLENATNKELEEIIEEAEKHYNEAQKVVQEHYAIMQAASEIYSHAFAILDKRMGGRLSKKRQQSITQQQREKIDG